MKYLFSLILIACVTLVNAQSPTKDKLFSDIDKLVKNAVGSKYSEDVMKVEIINQEVKAAKVIVSERLIENGEIVTETEEFTAIDWASLDINKLLDSKPETLEGNRELVRFQIDFKYRFLGTTTTNNKRGSQNINYYIVVYVIKKDMAKLKEYLRKLQAL